MSIEVSVEQRIKDLGLVLPRPMDTGHLPFDLVSTLR